MPKDDDTFRTDASAAYNAVLIALGPLNVHMDREWGDSSVLDNLAAFTNYFANIGSISGGTRPVVEEIRTKILPELEKFDKTSAEGPVSIIRGKLDEWDGPSGSASYEFKWTYLPALATSLDNCYSAFLALAAAIEIFEGLLDQTRQKFLDLMGSTVAAIGAEQAIRESSDARAVTAIAAGIATGLSSRGPAGAVVGIIQAIGGTIDAVSSSTNGSHPLDICVSAVGKMNELESSLQEEVAKVESALDEILNYVDGPYIDQFLAPEIKLNG